MIRPLGALGRAGLFTAALVGWSACASGPVLVGPKPAAPVQPGEIGRGTGCGLLLFGVIPVRVNSRTERAYREALHGRGSSLADTEVTESWYILPEIGPILCTGVSGRIVP
jgi:hypothetical protein